MKIMDNSGQGLPKVAIVGRPNVGKSSLFNRILRQRKAIVYSERGTTRDRVAHEAVFEDKRFILTDTGGFMPEDQTPIFKSIKGQIKKAIEDSDLLLFVCDAKEGLSPEDEELASLLRKSNKKIFLVVNKADNPKVAEVAADFYRLGLDRPYAVSALHDLGVADLLEDMVKGFPHSAGAREVSGAIRVAIVGRPNVGKSMFLNCLLKEERLIVDDKPGTTRDAIDTYLKDGAAEFVLIDTAGMRHKRKIKEAIDVYSIMRTKEAIKKSEVCVVLIDGYEGLAVDDLKILDLVLSEGKACVLCVNKWDLAEGPTMQEYKGMVYERAPFLEKYPIQFTSAKTGYNVYKTLAVIKEVAKTAKTRIPTNNLNRLLTYMKARGPFAPRTNTLKVHYATQRAINPPTFLMFANNARHASESHRNFIENLLRRNFDLFGTPIRIEFRSGDRKGERQ